MRNVMPTLSSQTIRESGIVNLDDVEGPGTHWVAYRKNGQHAYYFDSYGQLRPPREIINYLCKQPDTIIHYNLNRYQKANDWNCGHSSLAFLTKTIKPRFTKHV